MGGWLEPWLVAVWWGGDGVPIPQGVLHCSAWGIYYKSRISEGEIFGGGSAVWSKAIWRASKLGRHCAWSLEPVVM